MQTVLVNGITCYVFAERDDNGGGIVTNTLVPVGDGSYYNYRSWRGRGSFIGEDASDPAIIADKQTSQADALVVFNGLTGSQLTDQAFTALTVNGADTSLLGTVDTTTTTTTLST